MISFLATKQGFAVSLAVAPAGAVAGVVALTATLVGCLAWVVRHLRRRRKRPLLQAQQAVGTMVCPTCGREYFSGTMFCPVDARRLVTSEEAPERAQPGMRCPRCHRAFDTGIRYCPLDAEELVPQRVWEATHGEPPSGEHLHEGPEDDSDPGGKICPVCAAKYALNASFCGKDGSELVTVN